MKPARNRGDLLMNIRGNGLEIGALDSPVPLPPGVGVKYVDILTREECLRHYPELPDHDAVIEPDIIAAADDLSVLPAHSQDFLIACHLLEHMVDPIAALEGWHRVLKPGGLLLLVLPDKRHTFDSPRNRTPLQHLIDDHHQPMGTPERDRRDLMAYREWVAISKNLRTGAQIDFWAELLRRARYNIHFHCWIPEDIRELIMYLGSFEIEEEASLKGGWEFAFLLKTVVSAGASQ